MQIRTKLLAFELIRTDCVTLNKRWAWAVEQYIILVLLLAEQTVWYTTVCPVFQTLPLLGRSLFQIGEKGLWSAFDMGPIYLIICLRKDFSFPWEAHSAWHQWLPVYKDRLSVLAKEWNKEFGGPNILQTCVHAHTHTHTHWVVKGIWLQ